MGFFSKLFGKSEKAPAFDGNKLYAPLNGKAVPVTEVPDPTFAEGLLGNGIAIIPTDGKVCSPVDGTVETMFDTGHAVCLKSTTGVEILIHVGLETVGLNGAPSPSSARTATPSRRASCCSRLIWLPSRLPACPSSPPFWSAIPMTIPPSRLSPARTSPTTTWSSPSPSNRYASYLPVLGPIDRRGPAV